MVFVFVGIFCYFFVFASNYACTIAKSLCFVKRLVGLAEFLEYVLTFAPLWKSFWGKEGKGVRFLWFCSVFKIRESWCGMGGIVVE
jgi:hypothetical protein